VSFLSVLIELIGETAHMIMLNASHIGALLFQIHAWFRTKRRKKEITTMLSRGWWLSYNYLAAPRAVHFLTKSTHFALLLKQLYHSFPPFVKRLFLFIAASCAVLEKAFLLPAKTGRLFFETPLQPHQNML